MSAFGRNVLQNYFECPAAQHWFNINCQGAILIQRPVCLDSIIARSQCSEEFCNTFGSKADMAIALQNVRFWPKADAHEAVGLASLGGKFHRWKLPLTYSPTSAGLAFRGR
jgi:hypothetical protein